MDTSLVRLIEELAANAWPAEIVQHLGGWRLRYSGGSSRRVNSVWPNLPPAGDQIETALAAVEEFYQRHNTIPRFQICPASLPQELPAMLAALGYHTDAHTAVKIAPVKTVLANTKQSACKITSSATLTEAWFQSYTRASGYMQESLPIRRGILNRIGPEKNFILLTENGKQVATGLGVLERGWMGVFCVVTDSICRRRGFASGVMHLLADWGKSRGAEKIYLQVMEDNTPALRLYQRMGFEHLYQYSYYQKMPAF
ncbi:MAG: GNAT family N-acetyltransferase [Anaerolineales bacterium]|nr:GNAT family N-acetyltransferase [Anaerolineales bacterium]